jgi:purine-binding chemotaxis protein CheW
MKRKFVIFNVQQEEYGIDIVNVLSIEKNSQVTSLPQTPNYMLGIVNIRGHVMPVVDSNYLLFNNQLKIVEDTRFLMLEDQGRMIALIVESTNEIIEVDDEYIRPVDMVKPNSYIEGVVVEENRIISILKSDEMLSNILNYN